MIRMKTFRLYTLIHTPRKTQINTMSLPHPITQRRMATPWTATTIPLSLKPRRLLLLLACLLLLLLARLLLLPLARLLRLLLACLLLLLSARPRLGMNEFHISRTHIIIATTTMTMIKTLPMTTMITGVIMTNKIGFIIMTIICSVGPGWSFGSGVIDL